MAKPGKESPFLNTWGSPASEELRVQVPAGFKAMLEQAAHEQGTSCSSLVRYAVLRQVVGQAEANRLEPSELRSTVYQPVFPELITAVDDGSKKP